MKSSGQSKIDFEVELSAKAELINKVLRELLDKQSQIPTRLREAMEYTVCAGGKRLRGAIVLWCCELVGGRLNRIAEVSAAAIEMVHTYSLIHDDLPAMDDDDFRRGKPSCHKVFDEATAILAGDGLLTLAFEILAKEITEPSVGINLIRTLAEACGPAGMIAGQMADLEGENSHGTREELQYIHINKTAKMFACAAAMGGIAGGADDEQLEKLIQYGLKTGLGFQVADDILDISGTSKHLGKTAGKDAQQGKVTYPSVVGMEESKRTAEKKAEEAAAALEGFGERANTLRTLAVRLLERTR
jgi:geranylgeranyl diphosphate synthase type II